MSFSSLIAKAVTHATREWSKIKKQEERDKQAAARSKDRYIRGRSSRITIREAAFRGLPAAYREAAGNSGLATARQVMYKARPEILRITGETSLDDHYFTQQLLPDYQQLHPTTTADWDVVYDARGHFAEPHTGRVFGLGTLGVREYLRGANRAPDTGVNLPEIDSCFPTFGPQNRYGAVLYLEKEGFLPLLEQARIAERYDIAVMSSKGIGSTSARDLIGKLDGQGVKVLVVHDFDKSGFSIVGTLTRNTQRYQRASGVKVFDIGLRLADIEKWNLAAEAEPVSYRSNPAGNLRKNGANEAEIEFLSGDGYDGQRVEVNAFGSDDFIAWLESKFKEHGIAKVVPDRETLEIAYRRAASIARFRAVLEGAKGEVERYATRLKVPANLRKRIRKALDDDPEIAWDDAIETLLPDVRKAGKRKRS